MAQLWRQTANRCNNEKYSVSRRSPLSPRSYIEQRRSPSMEHLSNGKKS